MALQLEGVRPSTVGVTRASAQPSGAVTDRTDLDGVEARGRRMQHMMRGDASSVGSNLNALAATGRNARYPAYRKQHTSSSPERRRRTMEDVLRDSVAEQAAAHVTAVSQGVQVAATLHTRYFFPTTEVWLYSPSPPRAPSRRSLRPTRSVAPCRKPMHLCSPRIKARARIRREAMLHCHFVVAESRPRWRTDAVRCTGRRAGRRQRILPSLRRHGAAAVAQKLPFRVRAGG
jgi:hypothetical protein